VCRFYGTPGRGPNSHFFTADPIECDAVRHDPGWSYEGIAFNIDLPQNGTCLGSGIRVWRTYNGRFAQNDSNHRYSVSQQIYNQMLAQGWNGEGVVMCASP